jgi:hypothetical protein
MAPSNARKGTPQPWAEMLRRNWPRIHTIELHVRTAQRGAFASVEGAATTLPRPEDEDGTDAPIEGPEAAAALAGDMYERAWQYLHAADEDTKRLYFQLACYELKDGVLEQLAATAVGGGLRRDGTVAVEDEQEEQTERERARTREDWMWSRIVERDKMLMNMAKQFPALVEKVGELVDSTIEARAKVATAERDMRKDELDARVEMAQTDAAADAFAQASRDFGPAATQWAAAKYAEATRSSSTTEPHDSAIVNAARDVSAQADPATVVTLAGVLGWETVNDLQRALALAFVAEPSEDGIREAWRHLAPEIIASQEKLGPALPEEKARALAAAVMRLHSLCS